MESKEALREAYDRWYREAVRMAGSLNALSQRAAVYHHLFAASGRNHVFPLIAAHGALWAAGYFRFGMQVGKWLSLPAGLVPGRRERLREGLAAFADAFRDVNRRICIDTYTSFHFSIWHGEHPDAANFVPVEKLDVLNRMHDASRAGVELSTAEKRQAFEVFFRSEQATIVGPSVAEAAHAFQWPRMKFIALKPWIRFAYFPRGERLWFRDFSDQDERIANGMRAFELAARAGMGTVEQCLTEYAILPARFIARSVENFATFDEVDAVLTR